MTIRMSTGRIAIVQRGRIEAFVALQERLEDEGLSEVIWDRRFTERRKAASPVTSEQRRRERRQGPPPDWVRRGYVIAPRDGLRIGPDY